MYTIHPANADKSEGGGLQNTSFSTISGSTAVGEPVSMKPVYDETGSSQAPRNRLKPNLTGAFVASSGEGA